MVILCLNHIYFPVSECNYFLFTCQQEKTWLDWGQKRKSKWLSPLISGEGTSFDLRHRMKFTAKYRFSSSACPMLCERSCILRVQLQQFIWMDLLISDLWLIPYELPVFITRWGKHFYCLPSSAALRGRNPRSHGALLQPESRAGALLAGWNTAHPCSPLCQENKNSPLYPKYRCIS